MHYQGGLDRRIPEREHLNVTPCSHLGGKSQKLTFKVCLQTSERHRWNAWRHITQNLVMSRFQNQRQRGNLNLPIEDAEICTALFKLSLILPDLTEEDCMIPGMMSQEGISVGTSHLSAVIFHHSAVTFHPLNTLRELQKQGENIMTIGAEALHLGECTGQLFYTRTHIMQRCND